MLEYITKHKEKKNLLNQVINKKIKKNIYLCDLFTLKNTPTTVFLNPFPTGGAFLHQSQTQFLQVSAKTILTGITANMLV